MQHCCRINRVGIKNDDGKPWTEEKVEAIYNGMPSFVLELLRLKVERRETPYSNSCASPKGNTAMTKLPSVCLPTGELDENRALDVIGGWFSMMSLRLDKGFGRQWLQTTLEEGLREGEYELAIRAIKEADAGNEIADAALRTVCREMMGGALPKRGPGHLQVWAYGQRALDQPPHKRPRGRNPFDNFVRNILVGCCIILACREFGAYPTRNRFERRADRRNGNRVPSGVSLVVKALAGPGIHLDEASVQRNIWNGLPGELARRHIPSH